LKHEIKKSIVKRNERQFIKNPESCKFSKKRIWFDDCPMLVK